MAKFLVRGGKKLTGKIKIAGNKNAVLKLIPACLLADQPSILTNVPRIRDVDVMIELINKLGAKTQWIGKSELKVDPSDLNSYELDEELSSKIRASVVLAAPLLVKFGKAVITPPGGDQIGERLLDTHFLMLKDVGVDIKRKDGKYYLSWKKRQIKDIFLEESSVTATEMAIMMAASIPGDVRVQDAAAEPHVSDLSKFIRSMGADIKGAGSNTLEIKGIKNLKGAEHKVIADHVEGGTFIIAGAITYSDIVIEDFDYENYHMILRYLNNMGVKYEIKDSSIRVNQTKPLVAIKTKFQTRPWPGFPTDLMSPFIVLATQTEGVTLCHDWMYEWRMFFVDDLISMGAKIFIADPHRVIVYGPTRLMADYLYCKDIRAGMSLILAAMCAKGQSTLENIEVVERGYEKIEERLKNLGADIERVESDAKIS